MLQMKADTFVRWDSWQAPYTH